MQGVKIICQDYERTLKYIEKDDFVYLDPCYDPLKRTSFANYTPKRFSDKDNERLSIFVAKLKRIGAKVLLSNNITDNVERLYSQREYNRVVVFCSRSINCNRDQRGVIPEFLIKNY